MPIITYKNGKRYKLNQSCSGRINKKNPRSLLCKGKNNTCTTSVPTHGCSRICKNCKKCKSCKG